MTVAVCTNTTVPHTTTGDTERERERGLVWVHRIIGLKCHKDDMHEKTCE